MKTLLIEIRLQSQSEAVHRISLVLGPLQPELDVVRRAEHTCALYRAELNDYTIHTSDELETELHTLQERVRDRTLFIDKQASLGMIEPAKMMSSSSILFRRLQREKQPLYRPKFSRKSILPSSLSTRRTAGDSISINSQVLLVL